MSDNTMKTRKQRRRASPTRYRVQSAMASIPTTIAIILAGTAPSHAADSSEKADTTLPAADVGEIVVTAQRRSERAIDVPYNITAVGGADLETAGAVNANDLTKVVAGLNNFSDGPSDRFGQNNFTMRGLNVDSLSLSNKYTAASVATYYGDTPVFFPLLLKDLDRVEVLRGPQGTLYGSSAESGAIRFIPKRP